MHIKKSIIKRSKSIIAILLFGLVFTTNIDITTAFSSEDMTKCSTSRYSNDNKELLESLISIPNHQSNQTTDGLTIFPVWRHPDLNHQALAFLSTMVVIVDNAGKIQFFKEFEMDPGTPNVVMDPEFINSSTFMYIHIPAGLQLYNIETDTVQTLPFSAGHHDVEYNPHSDTFLTVHFTQYGEYLGQPLLFDDIYEYDRYGNEVWYWNSSIHIPFNSTRFNNESFYGAYQYTHANTIFWDVVDEAIYYNSRHLDTFYKIDYITGEIIWAAGKYGDFKLFDKNGNERDSLWFHSHAVEVIGPDRFIMFDNDYYNTSRDPPLESQGNSRMIEFVIDEETMTLNETWSWTAPASYFGIVWGDADRLPNGNRLGAFGVPDHPATLFEVDSEGNIVWELAIEQEEWNYLGIMHADRFYEAPLVEVDQTDIILGPDENLVLNIKTWDNFHSKIKRDGVLRISEKNEELMTIDFQFEPYWQDTVIKTNISSLGTSGRTLLLTITNEDGFVTTVSINVNGGESETSITTESSTSITTESETSTTTGLKTSLMIGPALIGVGILAIIRSIYSGKKNRKLKA